MIGPTRNLIVVLVFGLFFSVVSTATAQQKGGQPNNSNAVEYQPGQVWNTDQGANVTILLVETDRKGDKVVHVRIDNVPVQSCGGFHLTTTIEHMALSEKMIRKSVIKLTKNNVGLPDAYFDAYRKWEKQKKHDLTKVPLQEAILSVSNLPGPMICNFRPNET